MTFPDPIRFLVITLSDRASLGEYEDLSGPAVTGNIQEYFTAKGFGIQIENCLIPDDPEKLKAQIQSSREAGIHVIFTTGGTGIGPRDFTPDVVRPLLEKEIPGIMEMIRVKYGSVKPAALLSRSVAGVSGQTLIYCIPGSRKAVAEYCGEILPTIVHSIKMILGIEDHSC
ncbi:MAG: MogA/MoaB family molybdenum cofactor biosynthesis protein [Bacteroidota bacterium]